MCAKEVVDETTTWVPICCQTVMRHNLFRGEDNSLAATLVCGSCGKHVTLHPHTTGSIDDYGESPRVFRIVSVTRPARRGVESVIAPSDRDDTL